MCVIYNCQRHFKLFNIMSKTLRTNYGVQHQIESFFTGTRLEFENDGKHFYCSYDTFINKVSIDDGQVKAQIKTDNEEDHVLRFTLSPDNELLIIAYSSGIIRKFNLTNNLIERDFRSIHSAPVSFLKINQSSALLATGSSDGTIKLWNLKNHYCSHNLKGINGVIACIEFHESEDESFLFCSGGDDNIHIFDLKTGKRISKLSGHCSTITDLEITPCGSNLISIGRDKLAIVWKIPKEDTKTFEKIRTIPLYESVESLVIIKNVYPIIGHTLDENQFIFATIGEQGLIKFWDTKTGAKVFEQNSAPLSQDRCPGIPCSQLCYRPSYEQLCVVSSERDIFSYELPRLTLIQQLQGHIDEVLSACWFAKNKYIALACNSNDLKVINIESSKCQHLKGHKDIVLSVKSSAMDPFLLISSSKDCTILLWKFDHSNMNPRIIYSATGHTHAIHSLGVLSSEHTFLSGGEDTTLKRWSFSDRDIANDMEIKTLIASQTIKAHDDRIDDITISPNDQIVATASRDKTAKVFSVANLQILGTLKGHRRGVNAIQFSPVDQVIVTAADTNLRLWNLQDFSCIKTFQGHDCAVLNFNFLSNGLQLLSIGSDGNMKLWDLKSTECSTTIDAHSSITRAFSMTNDDNHIVTGGQDEKIIIWKDITQEEQEEKLAKLQSQVIQEQNFVNYMTKKKWRKALKVAISMANQTKTLNVIREILLESDGLVELEKALVTRPPEQLDFIIECCITWTSTAKNSSVAQRVLNILIRHLNYEQLMRMPSLVSSIDQLKTLTEKSFNRYERLVQEATFVDFFLNATRIQ